MKTVRTHGLLSLVGLLCVLSTSAQEFQKPKYAYPDAVKIAKGLYLKVLDRKADDGGMAANAAALAQGSLTVQEIVLNMGLSAEYSQRFITNRPPAEAITLMYRHFLLREPESQSAINHHVNELNNVGWQQKIRHFVLSSEGGQTWPKFAADVIAGRISVDKTPDEMIAAMQEKSKKEPTPAELLTQNYCKSSPIKGVGWVCSAPAGYEMCESFRKKGTPGVTKCAASFDMEQAKVDKALFGLGCKLSLGRSGNYVCYSQSAMESCEMFKKEGKAKACQLVKK